jgi:hypothetical protein
MTKLAGSIVGALVAAIALPAAAQQHYQGDICGNKVDVDLKAPDANANAQLKPFYGVWAKGRWSTSTCTGLIVSEINGDNATVHYYYGAGPDAPTPGTFTKTDAVMKGKSLYFHSLKGYELSYEMTSSGLKGWFGTTRTDQNLQKLQ